MIILVDGESAAAGYITLCSIENVPEKTLCQNVKTKGKMRKQREQPRKCYVTKTVDSPSTNTIHNLMLPNLLDSKSHLRLVNNIGQVINFRKLQSYRPITTGSKRR